MHKSYVHMGEFVQLFSLLTSAKNRCELLAQRSYRFNPGEISPINPRTEGWVEHGVTLTAAGEDKNLTHPPVIVTWNLDGLTHGLVIADWISVALNADTDTCGNSKLQAMYGYDIRHRITSRFFVVLQRRNEGVTDRETATYFCVKLRRFLR
jgi:hypothetical protein